MNKINPYLLEQYFLGGLLGDSVGGKTAGGALSGAMTGMKFGPIGAGIGALVGGVGSFIGSKKEAKAEAEAEEAMMKQQYANYISSSNMNQGNGSNLPMAMGGKMYANGGMLSPMFTEFNEGGTHESNPLGGVPQGVNQEGKQRTVEEGETSFRFKDGKYIFSNRLSPLSYEY